MIDRRSLEPTLQVLTMALMAAAVLLMGSGYGLHLSLLGLLVCMVTSNRSTVGVFCLLFGTLVVGYIFACYGYAGWGGDAIVAIGLVLLYSRYPLGRTIVECRYGVYLLFWCSFVLLFFYLRGPGNSYAVSLMIGFVKTYFLSFFAFYYLFRDRSLDWRQLGLLGIFSSLFYLAVSGRIGSAILPQSVWDVGSLRLMIKSAESSLSTHDAAFLSVLGFMFIYSKNADKTKTHNDLAILLISLFVTVVMVGWSGARQGLFFLMIGCMSIFACRIEGIGRRYLFPAMGAGLLLVAIVIIGVVQEFSIFTGMVDQNQSIYERLNRSTNWNAALWLIKEKPFLGHGLGGYSVSGYEDAERPLYAHNVILDLLTQTGIVGTVALFCPLFLFREFRRRIRMLLNLQNGNAILPVLCVVFLQSMVSGSFTSIGSSLAVLGVLPADKSQSRGLSRSSSVLRRQHARPIVCDSQAIRSP